MSKPLMRSDEGIWQTAAKANRRKFPLAHWRPLRVWRFKRRARLYRRWAETVDTNGVRLLYLAQASMAESDADHWRLRPPASSQSDTK